MIDVTNARTPLQNFTEHPIFGRTILTLIVINAIILGMETSDAIMASMLGPILLILDKIILGIFVVEVVLRLIADFKGFWRNPWRIFDLTIVTISLIPATGALSAMRAFRILRVLRLISQVRSMRRVVTGLLSALPGMGSIVLLLSIIFYVFAVISTKLFKDAFPEWFGSIGESSYTLFQIMTLESWSMGVVRPVMEQFPYAWLLFVPFIIMTAFTVLNLFIGVIVDAMQHEHEQEAREERENLISDNELILSELRALRAEVKELKTG
ncbi:ion transporter [Lentilitoribacter sp. EG35]|uniref:ion transporter n=1 Tax=Lentilitoribacter sp. EG35 TaxID=3234192 RepID=UPI003461163A